jgi:hypothetical protein
MAVSEALNSLANKGMLGVMMLYPTMSVKITRQQMKRT